ncbi:MAG: hypothetical protein KGL39_10985 [Patescibacteria group bacterium]|nr:hypothetical protein [Patescibacteria group bacterium]
MLVPVCCMSCGLSLAEFAIVYREMRSRRVRAYLKQSKNKVLPANAMIDPLIKIDMSDVFKGLGITQDCCVRAMTSHMDMRDYY